MMFEILLILATIIISMLAWASYRLGQMYYDEANRADFWERQYRWEHECRKLMENRHE